MKILHLLVISLLILALHCEESTDLSGSNTTFGYEEEKNVVILTDANYQEAMSKFQYALVEFYAPWCGHCKSLKPHYEKAAKKLKERDPPIPLVKVDATKNEKITAEMKVEGYPTLKWYANGEYIDYDGDRKSGAIIKWINKRTGGAIDIVKTTEEFNDYRKTNDNVTTLVLFCSKPASECCRHGAFEKYCIKNSNYLCVKSLDDALNAEHGNALKMFTGDKVHTKEGKFTPEELGQWVDENFFETPMPFENDAAVDRIFTKGVPAIFLFTTSNDEDENVKAFNNVAMEMKGKFIFSRAVFGNELGKNLAEYIGVKPATAPCVWIIHSGTGDDGEDVSNFALNGDITEANLAQFVENFKAGSLEREFKSEDVPETNDQPVKVVVGKNWEDMVINNEKDVLVMFYAPWCGHCKTLKPKYTKLARNLERMSDKLVIAKVDSTENDIKGVNIQSFPTLRFYKNGDKQNSVEYTAGRSVKGFTKWLKRHVSFTWVAKETPALKRDQMPKETPKVVLPDPPANAVNEAAEDPVESVEKMPEGDL